MNKKTNFFHKFFIPFLIIVVMVGISLPQGQAHAIFGFSRKEIFDLLVSLLYAVILLVEVLILAILNIGVSLSSFLVDTFLSPDIYVGVGPTPGVLTSNTVKLGWEVVRDICNMFFMFFLLIVAFGTMLRSKTYNIKNILPKIIISLFLINFSMVAAHLVIDISQFFMTEISGNWMGGGFSPVAKTLSSISSSNAADIGDVTSKTIVTLEHVVNAFFAIIFAICLIFIYLMLAAFLLIRLVSFAVLIIFSPVAFLGIAFPSMSKYATQWWGEITKWAIFGPVFIFFVYLATTMANELVGATYVPVSADLSLYSKIVLLLIPPLVPMVILLMAPAFASKAGVTGAGTLVGGKMGLGNIKMGTYALGKFGVGKAKQAGGAVAARSQFVRNKVEASKDLHSKALGAVGLHKQRSKYDSNREASKADKLKDAQVDLVGTIDIKNADTGTLKQAAESKVGSNASSAVYLKHLAETNQLDTLSTKEKKDHMDRARPYLGKEEQEKLAHKDLEMATMTDKGKARMEEMKDIKTISKEGQERINKGDSNIEEEYKREQLEEIRQKGELKNLSLGKGDEADLTAKIMVDALPSKDLQSAMDSMDDKKKEKFQGALMNNADYAEDAGDEDKSDKFRAEAFNAGKGYTKCMQNIDGKSSISEPRREKIFSRLDAKKIGKMNDSELAEDGWMANTTQSRMINRDPDKQEVVVKINASKKGKVNKERSRTHGFREWEKSKEKLRNTTNKADRDKLEQEMKVFAEQTLVKPLIKLNKEQDSIQSMIDGGQY